MRRALHLAEKAFPECLPNPGVGAVVVHNDSIIGEGYTQAFGGKHAEVMAIESVEDPSLLKESELYVTLEPCNHHGKTGPCSHLIARHEVPKVHVALKDPFEKVNGSGISYLQEKDVEVENGLLAKEARWMNRRFFTFHEKKRPYILLKWAESADGFIAPEEQKKGEVFWISSSESQQMVHQWRAEEMAILVGTRTALQDNPHLTVRKTLGANPLRILIDRNLKVPSHFNLYSYEAPTYVFNEKYNSSRDQHHWICIDFEGDVLQQILDFLYQMNIQSLLVEGGAQSLQSFIDQDLWDEARVFRSKATLESGVSAPELNGQLTCSKSVSSDNLNVFLNPNSAP